MLPMLCPRVLLLLLQLASQLPLAIVAPQLQPQSPPPPPHLLFVDRAHINRSDPRLQLRVQQPSHGPWVLSAGRMLIRTPGNP